LFCAEKKRKEKRRDGDEPKPVGQSGGGKRIFGIIGTLR